MYRFCLSLLITLTILGCQKKLDSTPVDVRSFQIDNDFFDLEKNPKIAVHVKSQPKYYYPAEAKIAKIQGTVVIHALVDKNGEVKQIHVITGPRELSETAVKFVSQWRFEPLLIDGRARTFIFKFTMPFTLH
jgi:TonB family protein